MRRVWLYLSATVVVLSLFVITVRVSATPAVGCPHCGQALKVAPVATATHHWCECGYHRLAPASGAFSWLDAIDYFVNDVEREPWAPPAAASSEAVEIR